MLHNENEQARNCKDDCCVGEVRKLDMPRNCNPIGFPCAGSNPVRTVSPVGENVLNHSLLCEVSRHVIYTIWPKKATTWI